MDFRVIESWQATYADPIHLAAGDPIHLTGRRDIWDRHLWLWARSGSGREGWIPDSIVSQGEAGCTATEDYTAAELTCRIGQILSGEKETHGWVYCRSTEGAAGWVPRKNLVPFVA